MQSDFLHTGLYPDADDVFPSGSAISGNICGKNRKGFRFSHEIILAHSGAELARPGLPLPSYMYESTMRTSTDAAEKGEPTGWHARLEPKNEQLRHMRFDLEKVPGL